MDQTEAHRMMREYKGQVRSEMTKEDKQVIAALRHIERGRKLIDVRESIKGAGLKEDGTPELAICRADAKHCFCRVYFSGDVAFSWESGDWRHLEFKKYCLRFPELYPKGSRNSNLLRAVVPLIPPRHRPPQNKLHLYHILWEAEWRTVPTDPLLLKHIRGDLYAVLAAWDLTAVERAVLTGRLNQR
jgi:hypothetical protein